MRWMQGMLVACALTAVAAAQDGGVDPDAGVTDASPDAGIPDAGDGGAPDAGDGGAPDAGAPDADEDAPDAGGPDAAAPDSPSAVEPELTEEDWDEGAMYGAEVDPDLLDAPDPGPDAPAIQEDEEGPAGTAIAVAPRDRLRFGGSVQTIGQEDLEVLEYDDPHSVLLQTPGLYVRTEDGFGLRPNIGLRGGNPERSRRVTLMEDGVLFGPAPYSAPAAYYFPLMSRMVGIEVFKGPAALLYGPQTIGGAVNLLTRPVPREAEGEIDLSYGSFQTRKLHLHYGASNRWGGILFEALDIGSDGFKTIDGTDDSTGFSRSDFMLRGFLQTDPREDVFHRFDLKLGFQRERSNETYTGLSDADFREDPYRRYASTANDRMEWWRTQGQLTWRAEVGNTLQVITDVYRNDFDRSWARLGAFRDGTSLRDVLLRPTGARAVYYDVLTGAQDGSVPEEDLVVADNRRRMVSQGIQSRARLGVRTGAVRHEIELGLRVHHDSIDRDHEAFLYRMRGGVPVPLDERETTTDNFAQAIAGAAYLVYGIDVAGLTLRPGIRTEVIHTRQSDELTDARQAETRAVALPGIGATYRVAESVSLLAGVHRGFSPVAPGQPAEVEPELSIAYEAGARFIEEGRDLELIGFVNDYSNLTGQCAFATGCSDGMLDRQFNGGSVLVYGVEAVAAWRFALGNDFVLPARVTYTFTGSSFRTAFTSEDPTFGDVVVGDELPYVPEHQGQVQVGLEHPRAGFRVVGSFVGEMREEAGQGPTPEELSTDRLAMVDVIAFTQLRPRLRLYLRLENVFDQQPIASRRPFGARPVRPFMVYIGLKADL